MTRRWGTWRIEVTCQEGELRHVDAAEQLVSAAYWSSATPNLRRSSIGWRSSARAAGAWSSIEASAGLGKSRLLTVAGDMAREAGMQVTGAQGTALEQDFPFGVAIQLFEPRWVSADAAEREHLIQGPAHWAGELLTGSAVAMRPFPGDQGYAVIHGLFRMACNLVVLAAPTEMRSQASGDARRRRAVGRSALAEVSRLLRTADRRPADHAGHNGARGRACVRSPGARRPERGCRRRAAPGPLSEQGVGVVVRGKFPDAEACVLARVRASHKRQPVPACRAA